MKLPIVMFVATLAALRPTDLLGASSVERPIRIGLVFDFSGKSDAVQELVDGIELADSQLNSGTRTLELIRFDSAGGPSGTRSAMLKAVAQGQNIDLIIAELDSSRAFVAAEVADSAQHVMVTPLATSYKITAGRRFVFSGTFSDHEQGRALADFATKEAKGKSASVIIDQGQLYSVTLAEEFVKRFVFHGGRIDGKLKILADGDITEKAKDFLLHTRSDIIFLPVYSQTAARILDVAIRAKVLSPIYIGGDAWGQYTQPFQDLIFRRDNALRIFWASHYDGNDTAVEWTTAAAAYQKVKGKIDFGIAQAAGYDVLRIAVNAVKSAGGAGARQDRIAAAMRRTHFSGLLGKVAYGSDNSNRKPVFILAPKNGVPKLFKEMTE